jgi:cyanophycinase
MARSDSVFISIGGGELSDAKEILDEIFGYMEGRSDPRMVVMTVATSSEEEASKKYDAIFRKAPIKHVSMVHISEREHAYDPAALKKVEQADALFFTGGDQRNVTGLMGGSPLDALLRERIEDGILVAGSSAGATMMSGSMITGGEGSASPRVGIVEIAPGMNIIPDTIIDTHFSERGRHGRLLTAVAHNPQLLGVGLDEKTGIVVKGTNFRVVGEGSATVMCGANMSHSNLVYRDKDETIAMLDIRLHVLPSGYSYDIAERAPHAPARAQTGS